MSGDKFDQLYNALKADGAVQGSRENFRKFVYAPGKQGYQNRKQLYDALHADGAVSSKSYEEFAGRLGLHAVNQMPRKPQTAAQMARSIGGGQRQQPQQRAQQPRSAFVQGLYQQDDAQKQQNVDYTSPKATQQMVTGRQNAQRRATQKAVGTITHTEERRRNQPIVKTGTPADQSIIKTQGQLENEMDASANNMVNSELGGYLDKVIGDEFKDAHARGLAALSAAGGPYTHGVGGADYYVGERAYQQQMDSQKQLENITSNIQRNIEATFSDPKVKKRVLDDAARLGVDPQQYITQHLAPALIQKAGDQFNKAQLDRMMAKGSSDYIASGILNSLTGTLLTGLTTTKNQRQMQQQADALTEEGKNPNYQPGIVDKAARGAVGFLADAPAFNLAGKAGAMVAGRVLGNGVKQAARLANMSKLQRAVYMAKSGAVSQGVTGILYGSTNAVAQNMSTGDDNSIGTNLKLALKGGLSEGASFATMGAIGGAVGGLGYKIGATGEESTFKQTVKNVSAKLGYEGFKVISEGIGMHVGGQVANLIENGKFDLSVAGTLEDVANVVALKLTHIPKLNRMHGEDGKREGYADAITRKFAEFVTSDAAKNKMWEFSNDDKDSIVAAGDLASVQDLKGAKQSYQKIMADPNVSWDAKAKFSAMVMGVMPSSRPMGDYHTFTFEKVGGEKAGYKKYINEYAADGTLLSKKSYDTADQRENALYNDAILRENTRLDNGFALSVDADTSNRDLQAAFLRSKGFDESKPLDYHVNATLTAGMHDHDSAIYKEFMDYAANHGETSRIVEAVAEQNGMTKTELIDAFQNKEPLKRTDEEQNACVQLRRAFEKSVFKEGEAHPEQSQMEGKDVAEDNGLGGEQPNPQPVVDELRNLRNAEQALDAAMDGNDVFKQVFEECQKQGMSPVDAYDVLIQNGLTQEDIAPLADYINANARVQGMQQATAQAIEEHVGARISDWSYHGNLNGEDTEKGTTVLHVTWEGKDYIVGNGDVAFDANGRAKEDVGEMLVCLDPETNTMEYVPTREVTFGGTESAENYAAKYREQLQMKNSEGYNIAAQEQAVQDAAKPQQEEKRSESKGANQNQPEQEGKQDVLPQDNTTSAKDNTTSTTSEAKEQPQPTRKFADGTDVPMTTDSKGRPTPDFGSMKPEQAAEILTQDFGENAEKVVEGQIKKAEQTLKDAEKMKVDYTAEPNDILEQEQVKAQTVEAAKKQLEQAQNIKKAMTAKKVAETVGKTAEEKVEGAHEAGSVAAEKFVNAPRLVGNKRTRTLPDGETKIRGHYEIVPAESLTPSHDVNNGYKKSEGFPVDAEGRTINDRDYEHDKAAQQSTDQIALKYNGQAIDQVPVVSDEGIVYDGNGRTMAGQKAAKDGTDGEYINELLENAQNFGFTKEQIEQSGIEHPRLVLVTDERLPYDTATFAKFNRNEKKTQSNTEQAVAKAKTLTSEEVGAIVADIEGNGSLDAFFNNSKAINDLVKTLVDKGIIGQNEVAQMMDSPERLSAQGKEYVKNLLLGSIFKPETIRMLGIDSAVKNKALAGIRAVMDNLKLGDYSLRDEIDNAIQLLYEARRGGNKVDTLLRTPEMFGESAAKRYPPISQMMALALEGKVADFRDLLDEYNRIAASHNTGEGSIFDAPPTKDELIKEYLDFKKWEDYGTGHSETEGSHDVSGVEKPQQEASGGNEPAETEPEIKVKKVLKRLATEITKQTGIEVVTDDKVGQSALEDAEATDSNVKFHKETDEDVLNALNNGETIKVYRAMQVIDGKLYPPMAAAVGGKRVEANELGVWIRADENPDLAIPDIGPKTGKQKVDKKTGELKWKFKLDKGGKDATGKKATDVNAAYNPYWHMSRSPLNDQFKSAWIRPNIVVVECETPVSELTSGYKAERAKDAVGEVDWKSGSVSGEVFKQTGRARKVILSRWCKPVRVLDDAEVAQRAKEFIGEAKVEIPENVLTPKQRIAFEEAGFKIGAPEKGVKKSEQILEALEKGLQIDNTVREQREAGGAVLDWGNVPNKARLANDELTTIIMQNNRAYIDELDKLGEGETIEHYVDANGYFYTFHVDKNHHIYMDEAIPKTSSANKERINELKNYYNEERARHLETVRSDRGETQSELGRSADSDGSTVGGRDSQDSAVGGGSERTDTEGNVERDTSRSEQSVSQIKEFRSANGEVYGFTVDSKIYLDTKKMKPETPLHEYTHLWTEALRNSNPTEWENVKSLFDEVDGLKEEVQKLYPELKGDDLYEEMITTFSGREGAKKLEEVVRGLASEEGKTVTESAKATSFIGKVKEALQKYWKGVADMLHIHFTSAEDVADKVLADWASGFNPRNFDDLHDKELESRIKVTDEEIETPSEYGPITKQKILIDGDKEVIKVDEPNENGEYTGSYYEYDGKKFGDLNEVADYVDGKSKKEPIPVMPKPVEPSNPIEKAAEDYKKEHPLTEEEILNTTAFDDLPEDQKQYCIDAAIDYLNGEDNSAIAEAYYRNAYEKRAKVEPKTEEPKNEVSADPMEGLKNAAEGYEKEKNAPKVDEAKPAKEKTRKELEAERDAADNEFEAALKELRKKQSGQLNSGFVDQNLVEAAPKLFSLAAKCAYTRIKLGMYDAKEVLKDMRERFKEAFETFDKRDIEKFYSEIMNQKWRDGDERMSLNEWAEHYRKLSPEYKEKLEGDSKNAEDRKMAEKRFIDKVNIKLGFGSKINGIVELRKMAEACGLKDIKDTDLQELAETAIVKRARGIASSESTNTEKKFERIKKLYENQPSLNQRDSERVAKQQYSTPAPYAFLADMYVKGNGKEVKSALEPSAGNGMLTIGLPMDAVHVNDIDAQRLENLRRQGFKNVTSQDGTQPFPDKDVDVVVTNPPFGSAETRDYDGYKISSLEGQMAINALESMKDNGRAAIIIGGKTEYAKNGSLNPKDKALLGYLYSHYNVEDVINVDGSLYAKQGTSYPTRIILINGRRLDENAFPPVKSKARAEAVKDYDELYKRINDDILRGTRMDSTIGESARKADTELDRPSSADTHEEGVRAGEHRGGEQNDSDGSERLSSEPTVSGANDVLDNQPRADREPDGGLPGGNRESDRTGSEPSQGERTEDRTYDGRESGRGSLRRDETQRYTDEPSDTRSGGGPRGQLQRVDKPVRGLSTEKVKYAPKSENPFTLKAVMPADQQEAVNKNLEKLGDADQFLVDELGYNDKDDLYSHLAAEQVDSVALALQQAKKGNAFIIGDMTGIGKGRQAASLIRYAKKQGQIPVYFTKTAGLLSDVYRDLVDIGSPDLRPFVFGSAKEAAITNSEGKVVFPLPSKKEVKRVLDYIEKNGKLPKEYDYVLTTYSQVSNGVYEFDEDGQRKERKLAKGKTFGAAALSGQRRRDAIEKLMDNGYLILDESHTAGGDSGQGNYFQHIIQKAKNVTFFSATFAKRPDNMPIYALRTAMNEAGMKPSELIDAVKRGGATLQEIMSQTLTKCGQMIRRERDMTGVTIDWRAIDEPEKVKEQREQYDSIIGLFNDIINFQRTYVSDYVDKRNDEMAAMQSSMGIKRGTESLGIKNVPFASKAFNTVQQVLLSLKAKSAAERAIDYLKQGMKPVIALNNTNESQTGNFAIGEEMDAPDLGTSLRKGLEGTLRYTSKNGKNESDSGTIRLEDLGPDAVDAYHNLEKKINETSTGLSLSPIDVIKNELEKAGYKVGELTGRQTEFVYNENGTVTKVKRADTDKKKLAREFNDGQIDALILNKSAATGISLHASSKYKDQRKRVMIVAQQQLDVNDEVQMRGRIDRTGQVARGAYEYVVSLIPAEQRLLMMFKAKLKSLDANTTSSQKSKFNEMEVQDITNKYGDKVVREYMAEHLGLYSRMADPFGWEKTYGDDLSSIPTQNLIITRSGMGDGEAGADASKLLGRMALLKVSEQEKMLNEIGELYANEIQRLNEMGENDLEITELPLKAKTIGKEVWKEGAEPGGDNAFADNTYIEKVNMAILKKPMRAEEVEKAQSGLTGGRSWDEYKEEKKADVKKYFDQKIADETQKYEERAVKIATKAKEKYQKDAKKGQKDSGMSDEQIEKNAGFQYDNIYKQEKDKLNDVVKNLQAKAEMFDRVLDTFNTEDAYVLPVDMNNPNELSGFGNSYGRLIDIKITDNFSPNASSVSFATLDGRRKITFPIAGKVGSGENKADVIAAIDRLTRQASGTGDKQLRVLSMDTKNWDRLVSNESRKDGYIITGNLMQALIDTKQQGVGGQLVKYTTDTGDVKTGILMPDRFEPKSLSNEYPISSVAEKFDLPATKGGIDEVVSSDESIKIKQSYNPMLGRMDYEIRVPKSKAKGGKFFLDKDLLSMMDGNNFESRGNTMMAEFKENQLRPVLARLSNLGVKVREERKSSEDGTHYRTANDEQGNDAQNIVANHIASVSKKVGVKANEVNSLDEITNPRVKADIESGKPITGWYDEKTGEVHLYMPNIHDRYTAEKTIWHEVVGHKGLRELFGEDKFDKFLRSIWYDLDKPENADLKKLVMEEMQVNPLGAYDAIEEGLARFAEEGKGEPGFWTNIKNKVTDFLHEIGYRIAPNTKDVKYLMWLSKNLQKNPNDPYYRMRAEAVKYRLDHEDVPDVIYKDGMYYNNDGKARDLGDLPKKEWNEATDGEIHFRTTPSAGTALDRYHKALNAHGYMFTESYMDNMLSLKNLMTAIMPGVKIEDIKSSENPYILQNTMQGAMSDAAQMFERNVMKPLDKAMADVLEAFDGKKDDEKIRNFNLYMIKKHGLERNRVFFVRDYITDLRRDEATVKDADDLQQKWDAEKKDLGDKLRNGSIDLREYYQQMDEWIRGNVDKDFDAGEHDMAGLHGVYDIENADPYNDADVISDVMDAEAKMESVKAGSVKDYWDKVKAATQYALDCDYKNGLVTKQNHDKVSAMFDWYVPLRKFDDATAEDVYGYITEKGDHKSFIGPTLMRARGRKSLSETNILAQIGAMGNGSINRGGKNAIKQAFARFIRSHADNNLVKELNVWIVENGTDANGNPRWEEAYPQIPEDATPDEVAKIVSDFETDMNAKKAQGKAQNISKRGDFGFKFERAADKSQHIVDVMIAGKKHSFIVYGNPRAAQALNGLLENSAARGVMKPLGTISRMMAQLCTSYNPEFVMRNVMRDAEFASSNVTAKEGARYGAIWAKYYAQLGLYKGASNISMKDLAGTSGLGLFAKYRNGTLDMNDKIQRYFKEFMENGGETGWVQIKNMKEWEKQYKQDVSAERSKVQKSGKMVHDFFFGNLENLNEVAENIARFSTYCASRDFGRSVVRSTYDAKEVSTNFNRHGSGDAIKSFKNGEMTGTKAAERWAYGFTSSYLRHCSMFFNAGIQSTNLLVKNIKNNPIGTTVNMLSVPFALGALAALLNNSLIASEDEKDRKGVKDPYGELPDYVRRNNLCIYKGNGEFITIPLAIELRAFYGLGDLAAGLTFSPNVSGQKNPYFDAVGCMSQLVPVMDYLGNSSAGKKPLEETIKAISPSAITPFVEWGQNSDWKGSPIERRGDYNENVPAWQRAYNGTPEGLKNINKWVNAETNDVAKGNEDMLGNGFLDMVTNPSMLNHFFGGIGGGAATFAERTLGTIKHGKDTETKDIPFVRSLFYTPSEQSSLQRTKSKWYNYKDEMEKTMANVSRLKSKNVPIDKRIANIGDYYNFQNSKDAAKVRVIDLAEKQMKQWKKMRDKSSDTESINFANQNIDRIMMDAVDELDKLN